MNTAEYFQTLSQELRSLQNRVRNFIGGAHWLTDGEWKESVVRSMLRRHLPKSVEIGRGFIVSNTGNSQQIDVLLYSADVPVLFRDGDLVFVTPDAVLGLIEVKTKITSAAGFRKAVKQLTKNAEWAARNTPSEKFFGVFAYDSEVDLRVALEALSESADGNPGLVVDLICLGEREFIRWSKADPHNTHSRHGIWRAYQRLDGKAFGYFLHNAIQLLAPKSVGQNIDVWFPTEGKDAALVGEQIFEPRPEYRVF